MREIITNTFVRDVCVRVKKNKKKIVSNKV